MGKLRVTSGSTWSSSGAVEAQIIEIAHCVAPKIWQEVFWRMVELSRCRVNPRESSAEKTRIVFLLGQNFVNATKTSAKAQTHNLEYLEGQLFANKSFSCSIKWEKVYRTI